MSAKPDDWLPDQPIPAPESIGAGWKSRLLRGKRGGILGVVANVIIALRHAPEWQGVLRFNESSMATLAVMVPPFGTHKPRPFPWADEHDVLAAAWMQHQGIPVSREIVAQAVHAIANEHSFHPIRDYLDSLKWDGTNRIDDWLSLYMGVDTSEFVRAVGPKFLIGAVARVYRPGCKNDTCPIFEGPQGAQKSTALRCLASDDFFSDDIAELGSKDSVMQTRGVWIIELSELDAMSSSEKSRVKAFMSRQVDRIRPPYGRRVIEAPRECVFAGTVNKDTYLRDETGARRFWPLKCGTIRILDLQRERDQLWAEARQRFQRGDTWWLDSKPLIESAAEAAGERYEGDPWDERIEEWLQNPTARLDQTGHPVAELGSTRESVTVTDILVHFIGKRLESWTQTDQTRVARSLTAKGWTRHQKRTAGRREWRYKSPVSPLDRP